VQKQLRAQRQQHRACRSELSVARQQIREGSVPLPDHVQRVVKQARAENLTFLREPNLRDLAAIVLELEGKGVPGRIIEAGTARGGSAIVIAAAKSSERPMSVYDVFDMIPPPTDKDGRDVHQRFEKIRTGRATGVGGEQYYGYRSDLLGEVRDSFTRLGVPPEENTVDFVKGLFQDTLAVDGPVAFAHLDGDWYDSTMTCLQRIAPFVSLGGRIVLDDYYAWSGCRRAVDEFFAERADFRLAFRAKVHAIRVEPSPGP
jgi:asparagine synthase (glutamine-hydrolysing)